MFDDVTIFETSSIRMVDRARDAEKCIASTFASFDMASEVVAKSTNRTGRRRIEALPMAGSAQQLSSVGLSATPANKWKALESRLQSFKQSHLRTTKVAVTSRMDRPSNKSELPHSTRPLTTSLFLSPSTRPGSKGLHLNAAAPITLFSPPPSISTRESAWEIPFRVDQEKVQNMTFVASKPIKEVDASVAAQEALSGYGTALEKVTKRWMRRGGAKNL